MEEKISNKLHTTISTLLCTVEVQVFLPSNWFLLCPITALSPHISKSTTLETRENTMLKKYLNKPRFPIVFALIVAFSSTGTTSGFQSSSSFNSIYSTTRTPIIQRQNNNLLPFGKSSNYGHHHLSKNNNNNAHPQSRSRTRNINSSSTELNSWGRDDEIEGPDRIKGCIPYIVSWQVEE